MSTRRIRFYPHGESCHLSQRCFDASFFLHPSPAINHILGCWLARAQAMYGIVIYSYCFMGNHFHMHVYAPNKNLEAFIRYFKAHTSRAINAYLGRKGPLWAGQCFVQTVPNQEAFDALNVYIENNPVNAGLCSEPSEWCGLSSANQESEERIFEMLHVREWDRKSKRSENKREDYIETYKLRLENFVARVKAKVMDFFKGNPFTKPEKPKRSKRTFCFGVGAVAEAYEEMYKAFVQTYRALSERYRNGDLDIGFPEGSYRPPICTVVWEKRKAVALASA